MIHPSAPTIKKFSYILPGRSVAFLWDKWLETDGKEGEKPPAWALELWELAEEAQQTVDMDIIYRNTARVLEIQNEQVPYLPIVSGRPDMYSYSPNLGNIPENSPITWRMRGIISAGPWAWYYK